MPWRGYCIGIDMALEGLRRLHWDHYVRGVRSILCRGRADVRWYLR